MESSSPGLTDVHVHLAALPDGGNGCYPQWGDALSKTVGIVAQTARALGLDRATLQQTG